MSIALLLLSLAGAPSTFASEPPEGSIPNFRVVHEGEVYRGGRPEESGLQWLVQAQGVKLDLDLENDDDAIANELQVAESLGLRFVSKPMSAMRTPNEQEVNEIEALLNDASNYPIYVHCQHGQDRTGLIIGLFRVFHDGWKPADAHREMLEDGFHPIFIGLDHYFKKKTGWDD